MSDQTETIRIMAEVVGSQMRDLKAELQRDNAARNHRLEVELNAARQAMDHQSRHSLETLEIHARRLLAGI